MQQQAPRDAPNHRACRQDSSGAPSNVPRQSDRDQDAHTFPGTTKGLVWREITGGSSGGMVMHDFERTPVQCTPHVLGIHNV
eukprot:9146784-Heterocapsa_arctica.AAC.1